MNLNIPGEYTGLLEITYPDGSKENVEVKIVVEKVATNTIRPKTGDTVGDKFQVVALLCSAGILLAEFSQRQKKKKCNTK